MPSSNNATLYELTEVTRPAVAVRLKHRHCWPRNLGELLQEAHSNSVIHALFVGSQRVIMTAIFGQMERRHDEQSTATRPCAAGCRP